MVDGEKPGVDFGDEGKHTVQSLAANKTLPALLATITSFTAQDGYGMQACIMPRRVSHEAWLTLRAFDSQYDTTRRLQRERGRDCDVLDCCCNTVMQRAQS